MATALFPGSFDPITLGHLTVIKQASKLFDHLYVVAMTNSQKHYLFSVEERKAFIADATSNLANVTVLARPEQLTVDLAHELGAGAIVRGVRNSTDFLYEQQIAGINRELAPDLTTVILFTDPKNSFVASSMIKEVAKFGGPVEQFLPSQAAKALKEKMGRIDD